jgi:hypothetical protein
MGPPARGRGFYFILFISWVFKILLPFPARHHGNQPAMIQAHGELMGGLGLYLDDDGEGGIVVSEILKGGPADNSRQLQEGDR